MAKVQERAIIERTPSWVSPRQPSFCSLTDDKAKSFATDKFYLLRILANHNISTIGERLAHSNRAMNEFACQFGALKPALGIWVSIKHPPLRSRHLHHEAFRWEERRGDAKSPLFPTGEPL